MVGVADVFARVSDAAFGRPLVTNVLRGHVAEAIVALALEPEWHWCAADYAAWDFERADGLRLEVKQSAYLQSWASTPGSKVQPSFDVRGRTGRWEGATCIDEVGRPAHLYLFCYHDRRDGLADHRDPRQWKFYVVTAKSLPQIKRIGIAPVRRLAASCTFDELERQVAVAALSLLTD